MKRRIGRVRWRRNYVEYAPLFARGHQTANLAQVGENDTLDGGAGNDMLLNLGATNENTYRSAA